MLTTFYEADVHIKISINFLDYTLLNRLQPTKRGWYENGCQRYDDESADKSKQIWRHRPNHET